MSAHRPVLARVLALVVTVALLPFGFALARSTASAGGSAESRAASTLGTGDVLPPWVAISTGPTSSITLNDANGQVGVAQTLKHGPYCGVDQGATSSRFLTMQGSTGNQFSEANASYHYGSIGVKGTSLWSCTEVNAANEQLRLTLADGLSDVTDKASSAFLDLDLRHNARIVATLSLEGTTTGSYELQSGATIGLPALTDSPPFQCTVPARWGLHPSVKDNCRWPISVPSWTGPDDGVFFDTITLKAVSGAFSLEGGSDGIVLPQSPTTTPNASIIELAEGAIECGEETRTEAAVGDQPEVTVLRLDNIGGEACEPVPYSLSNSSQSARFLKPLNIQTDSQFVWDLRWRFPQVAGSNTLPELKIDYEIPEPGTTVTLGWCPDPTYDSEDQFLGYGGGLPASATDQEPDLDGVQFACVISRDARSVDGAPDVIASHDYVYVYGDAKMQW